MWLTGMKIVSCQHLYRFSIRFFIELEEAEMRSTNKLTSETLFKSAAIAKVINLDKTKFSVGYHWDPVKQVSDLRMASISFPKSLVQYPSCLDYIQVRYVTKLKTYNLKTI